MISESKATRLASHIQLMIEQRGLEPGTPIGTKAELLEQHKVASGTLNEALRLLQSRGYLSVKPGPKGGAFVSEAVGRLNLSHNLLAVQDNPKQLDECFQVQDALQERICVGAAAVCTAQDAERIMRAVVKLRAVSESEDVLNAIWDIDTEIAMTSPNRMLCDIYCIILTNIRSLVEHWPPRDFGTAHIARIHEDLALAIVANDVGGAQKAAREHSPINHTQAARELLASRLLA